MNQDIELAKTPLHELHLKLGARMVPFAGYNMPVQYPDGIIKEHLHTRQEAGLFDVSHMGQILLFGKGVTDAMERLVPVDLGELKVNQQTYAVFTNPDGGILDDLIIARWAEDQLFVVVNAACKQRDIEYLREHLEPAVTVEELGDKALMALQGPAARPVIKNLSSSASELFFMNGCQTTLNGIPCYITCSGYTGEDGFEISCDADQAENIAELLLEDKRVAPVGLGARDSLRLEAGLCLYGHDMTEETTPIEASLIWSISKSRRVSGDSEGDFVGSSRILNQIVNGVSRKRVGLSVEGKIAVREGVVLENSEGEQVGVVTSGGFGPSVGAPIAMAMVDADFNKVGQILHARVRKKVIQVEICKLPFVKQTYYRKSK